MWPSPDVYLLLVNVDDKTLGLLGSCAQAHRYHLTAYPTALSFLENFDRSLSGCVVADFGMPDGGGWELVEVLQAEPPQTPIIFLSASMDVGTAVALMKNGAMDVLVRPVSMESLGTSIERAVETDRQRKQVFAMQEIAHTHYTLLTPREREVFHLVVSGLPSKGIAQVLDRSQKTIEVHRTSIMKKMEAKSVVDLVRMGIELGGLDQQADAIRSKYPTWQRGQQRASAHKAVPVHSHK